MYYTLVPSLEHIALVKLSVMLWNQADIKAEWNFGQFGCHFKPSEWRLLENNVKRKVRWLSLPKLLEMKISNLVGSVGEEILKWGQYHDKFLRVRKLYVAENIKKLHWTPQGTVDGKKTAESLIKDEDLAIASRYILACHYCFETDIREVWNKLPECDRSFFCDENSVIIARQELVYFWTYYIVKGEESTVKENMWRDRCTSTYQYLFEYAVYRKANTTAARYFLQKLNPKERAQSLVRCAREVANKHGMDHTSIYSFFDCRWYPKEYDAKVVCFLLSQMNDKEQSKLFRKNLGTRIKVLDCFFNWPQQNLFMEVVDGMRAFISKQDYIDILRNIADRIIKGREDYDYETLFEEVWQRIPTDYKSDVADACIRNSILTKFFEVKDVKNIKSILKGATPSDKKHLIFSDVGKCICEDLVHGNNWDLLELFIGECISTKLDMMCIKAKFEVVAKCSTEELPTLKENWDELFENYMISIEPVIQVIGECPMEALAATKRNWNKLFQLLDDFIRRYDKRKRTEEVDSSPAKKKKKERKS